MHAVSYIFDPKLDPALAESEESLANAVTNQMITVASKEAEDEGFEVEFNAMEGAKSNMAGVVLDKRFHRLLKKEGKGVEAHFYRIIVGKDFVVVGMVLTAYDGKETDANLFLDDIVIEEKK